MPRVKTFFIFLLLILLLASSSCKYFLWVLYVIFLVIFSLKHCVFLTGQAGRTQTGKEPAYQVAKVMSMFNHLHASEIATFIDHELSEDSFLLFTSFSIHVQKKTSHYPTKHVIGCSWDVAEIWKTKNDSRMDLTSIFINLLLHIF